MSAKGFGRITDLKCTSLSCYDMLIIDQNCNLFAGNVTTECLFTQKIRGTLDPLRILGNTTADGLFRIVGDATVDGLFTGATGIFTGEFDVAGNVLVDQSQIIYGDLCVFGNTLLKGNTTFGNLIATTICVTHLDCVETISGPNVITVSPLGHLTQIEGNLLVTEDICVYGNVQTDLIVPKTTDQVVLGGNFLVEGNLYINTIRPATIGQPIYVENDLDVAGNITVGCIFPPQIDIPLQIKGDVIIQGNTTVEGNIVFEFSGLETPTFNQVLSYNGVNWYPRDVGLPSGTTDEIVQLTISPLRFTGVSGFGDFVVYSKYQYVNYGTVTLNSLSLSFQIPSSMYNVPATNQIIYILPPGAQPYVPALSNSDFCCLTSTPFSDCLSLESQWVGIDRIQFTLTTTAGGIQSYFGGQINYQWTY